METNIEHLRKTAIAGAKTVRNCGVKKYVLAQELTFVEKYHREEYFLIAHQLMKELRKNEGIIIGPGWDWMIGSHVCCALGLTNISPRDADANPILTWGNEECNPTISIEVDEESLHLVFSTAIELFGFENVARMPVKIDKESHYALMVCLDGIANHFAVEEATDKMLCVKESVAGCDNKKVFRFDVIPSVVLSRIKRVQEQIAKNGKKYPKLYEAWIWNEDYQLFYDGDLSDIPMFGCTSIQELTQMLLPKRQYGNFGELLNVLGLFHAREGFALNEETIAKYQQKHGVFNILGQNVFPWGFLYREEVAWFLNGWIGLSWKQTAQVMAFADAKKEGEAETQKHIYLHQGMDNGFKEAEQNRIWDSLFKRKSKKPLPSKAHYAGRLYLSVFLVRLKRDFPEEFNTAHQHEKKKE